MQFHILTVVVIVAVHHMLFSVCNSFVPMIQRCLFRQLCWPRTTAMLLTLTWDVRK